MVSFFLDYFRYAAETTVATLLLSVGIEKRGRFWLRLFALHPLHLQIQLQGFRLMF